MKKSTLEALYNLVNGRGTVTDELRNEVNAEYERTTAKSRENAALYNKAHDIAMETFSDVPMTAEEAFNAAQWPEGFSLSRLRYAVREYWAKELNKQENGKNPLTYTKKNAD